MLSKVEAGKKTVEESGNRKLLHEIETISKALYLDKNPARNSIPAFHNRVKTVGRTPLSDPNSIARHGSEEPSRKEKRSIWNWKPLKAFSHIRNRRFNCCFSLQVHSIEVLPSYFNGLSICVYWKRRDGVLVTRPVTVSQDRAEFEERLNITCSVYGSRNGPHHSAKYEAKHFLLYASAFSSPELDLGKHRVDLTRLLPLTLEELEESSGKWTTSFKLSGKAKGAMLNVSFGYEVIGDNSGAPGNKQNAPELLSLKQNNVSITKAGTKFGQGNGGSNIRRTESLPSAYNQNLCSPFQSVENVKDLHEVLPTSRSELASSVDILYQKLEVENSIIPVNHNPEVCDGEFTENLGYIKPHSYMVSDFSTENVKNDGDDNDFSIVERGMELSSEETVKSEEIVMEAPDVFQSTSPDIVENDTCILGASEGETNGGCKDESVLCESTFKEDDMFTKVSLMKVLDSALNSVSDLEKATVELSGEKENFNELELDDVTESVATEFLNMLGIDRSPSELPSDSDPESPRERLLRQFEKEALAGGCSLFDFDTDDGDQSDYGLSNATGSGWRSSIEDHGFSSIMQAAEEEHFIATQVESSKAKAKILEDLETESLMREWGLNERAFQYSPPNSPAGFGSPIDLPPEELLELPFLGEGLGPFLQTKNGGFLRSMSPSQFRNAKVGGSLIMQVSSPVVVPAEMGSGIMEILQCLASIGIEKLSMQANKLMPLEDITGKTMEQIAWEAVPSLEGLERDCPLQHEPVVGQDQLGGNISPKDRLGLRYNKTPSNPVVNEMGECVSLENLAPLAMDKIEALSIEGLRIQSGMSDEEPSSNITSQSIGEISALQGKGVNISGSLGLEGAAGLQLLDMKDDGDELDGLMGLSLTLDEWMRLDSGQLDDEDNISERTSKILAAHHAHSLDYVRGTKGERRRGKGSSRKCGLLGNNFTVALMVQLRDPMRDYETVGTPMLALIQVERVFIPPKPKIYSKVTELRSNTEDDDESDLVTKEETTEEAKDEKSTVEEGIPQFKITEIHVAGLKTDPCKKKPWGTTSQQLSGSRWLMANGMGKSNKHPLMKSKTVTKSNNPAATKVQPGDALWSISSRNSGTGAKWKEVAAMNPHIRNPNIILPNQTTRLR